MKNAQTKFYTGLVLGALGLFALIATFAFAGGVALAPYFTDTAQAAPTQPQAAGALAPAQLAEVDNVLAAYETALERIYDEAVPSVVRIDVTQAANDNAQADPHQQLPEGFPFPFPNAPDGFSFPQQGQGSGFVWDDQGHIVTNFHVVQGADKIDIIFADGTTVPAEVLGTDPNSDLAVLKIDLPANQLTPMPLGDSDVLEVGQLSIAIGAPFGQDFTMTSGIVSAVGRTIRSGNGPFSIPEAIQTDAPINPGNSGGPLLNRHGEVIGINSQILSRSGSNSGIGFAVPINIAKQVVPTLINGKSYEYAWLGISGTDLPAEVADLLKLPASTKGAMIGEVVQDGPAEKAGLVGSDESKVIDGVPYRFGGDIITAVNGTPIKGINDLIVYLVDEVRPGDKATFTILHDGEETEIEVILGVRPNN